MKQTTSIVREENGNCQNLLEKGARNGTRNDQKIATQLVDFAQKMMNPQPTQRHHRLMNTPPFAHIMRQLGM